MLEAEPVDPGVITSSYGTEANEKKDLDAVGKPPPYED